ncbi:chaperone modulator CbpM [Methylohalobius crimeensis]|uniref:chaperone modulator CbpM n=1 Tax=Methylohalobius crimeensis TaxID=244365 RepID=UPI0003B5B93A|nr:chaperone modulator CbpM [Methylohalobius crimeensis]
MREEKVLSGVVLDEHFRLTLVEICRVCEIQPETVIELVNEGVIEAEGLQPSEWRFDAAAFQRLRIALRLERDLGVNPVGAALVLDLLEELNRLPRSRF